MSTNTKERIVDAGAALFRRQGYAGTGVSRSITEAEAPFSSLYHFFPYGRPRSPRAYTPPAICRCPSIWIAHPPYLLKGSQLLRLRRLVAEKPRFADLPNRDRPALEVATPTNHCARPPPTYSRAGSNLQPSASYPPHPREHRARACDRPDRRARGRLPAQPRRAQHRTDGHREHRSGRGDRAGRAHPISVKAGQTVRPCQPTDTTRLPATATFRLAPADHRDLHARSAASTCSSERHGTRDRVGRPFVAAPARAGGAIRRHRPAQPRRSASRRRAAPRPSDPCQIAAQWMLAGDVRPGYRRVERLSVVRCVGHGHARTHRIARAQQRPKIGLERNPQRSDEKVFPTAVPASATRATDLAPPGFSALNALGRQPFHRSPSRD